MVSLALSPSGGYVFRHGEVLRHVLGLLLREVGVDLFRGHPRVRVSIRRVLLEQRLDLVRLHPLERIVPVRERLALQRRLHRASVLS